MEVDKPPSEAGEDGLDGARGGGDPEEEDEQCQGVNLSTINSPAEAVSVWKQALMNVRNLFYLGN